MTNGVMFKVFGTQTFWLTVWGSPIIIFPMLAEVQGNHSLWRWFPLELCAFAVFGVGGDLRKLALRTVARYSVLISLGFAVFALLVTCGIASLTGDAWPPLAECFFGIWAAYEIVLLGSWDHQR
jgi:hypothetical protein